jgi:hypothetical protein
MQAVRYYERLRYRSECGNPVNGSGDLIYITGSQPEGRYRFIPIRFYLIHNSAKIQGRVCPQTRQLAADLKRTRPHWS